MGALLGDELLVALHEGLFEQPPWKTFLNRFRSAVHANYVGLVVRHADAAIKDRHLSYADGRQAATDGRDELIDRLRLAPYETMEPNRLYKTHEVLNIEDNSNADFRDYLRSRAHNYVRCIRITEPAGGNAWLTISRSESDFTPEIADFIAELAPHLSISIRTLAAMERERMRANIAADAVRRLNFGWLTLDAAARVVDIEPEAERIFRETPGLERVRRNHPLRLNGKAGADLQAALAALGSSSGAAPRAIHLHDEPWLDMLLVPSPQEAIIGGVPPIAVAYLHGEGGRHADRRSQLMSLFSLTLSEAQIALALSRGRTLAEAGAELGLTTETARFYSKRIYSKTATRGQTDLVRLILASVIALA